MNLGAKMQVSILLILWAVAMVRAGDYYERVLAKMAAVTSENCVTKPRDVLHLPRSPDAGQEANKTLLRLAATLALQQAFFHSMDNQVQNSSADFDKQVGFLYRYNSIDSYVTATPEGVLSAGLFYDRNKTYANWWISLFFNATVDLFGLRAMRQDPQSRQGGLTLAAPDTVTRTVDYGADFNLNYTHPAYKTNDWYSAWMPDDDASMDQGRRSAYTVTMGTGKAWSFFGPPRPWQNIRDLRLSSVAISRPYFDCGKSDRWVMAVSAPVLDFLARYSPWTHLRRPWVVAASVVTVDFTQLDLDPCLWSSRVRCKNTTQCQQIRGRGFDPTAYQCVCLPGYQYPPGQNGPFQGSVIANATEDEFTAGFDCQLGSTHAQTQPSRRVDVTPLLQQMTQVTSQNCASKRLPELTLSLRSRDILSTMSVEGQVAVRLAHVIGAALQTLPLTNANIRVDAQRLQATHMYEEVTSAVMAAPRIRSATVIFDAFQFGRYSGWKEDKGSNQSSAYFVPSAWRADDGEVKVADLGGESPGPNWVKDILSAARTAWSVQVRERLKTVERWWDVRLSTRYQYSAHHSLYPIPFRVAGYEEGQWQQPHFKCDGMLDAWVATYSLPFFDKDLSLVGVVTVDVQVTDADLRATVA